MLTLENVSKTYKGGKKAVNNVNLKIAKGEFICFIGPSGCGKTTTMKMINRLIEPSAGKIFIDGENIMDQDPVEAQAQNWLCDSADRPVSPYDHSAEYLTRPKTAEMAGAAAERAGA